MGTLTVGVPRLDEHCPHKLATSCRMTSTQSCCACVDDRAHSRTYGKYIDGIGFVPRGTRWQAYCWYCKTFWDNRVAASGLDVKDTHIPDRPDVTEFLERWFEFHQGYRLKQRWDGVQERIAVLGEELKDVAPGLLPRTLDEMRLGRSNSVVSDDGEVRKTVTAHDGQLSPPAPNSAPVQSIEDVIDELLAEVDESPATDSHARPTRHQQTQASAEVRQSSERHRAGFHRIFDRRTSRDEDRQTRFTERMTRVFGSREEIQSDDYVSPIAGMFNRAWARYHNFEEMRRAQHNLTAVDNFLHSANLQAASGTPDPTFVVPQREYDEVAHPSGGDMHTDRPLLGEGPIHGPWGLPERLHPEFRPDGEFLGLDGDNRPPPLSDEQMMVKLDCKVCLQQRASIVCLPCGHLGMCEWCADQVIPVKESDSTKPAGPRRCPMCRKWVNRRVPIFTV